MLFKLGELKQINNVLSEFIKKELPISCAWRLNRFLNSSLKEEEKIEQFRIELIKKYGEEIEEGKWEVKKDNLDNFVSEFNDLLNEQVEIDFQQISVEILEKPNIEITLEQIQMISKLLKD